MNTKTHRYRTTRRSAGVLLGVTLLLTTAIASGRGLDDIRLSKIGAQTTIEIEFGCAMRYLGHTTAQGGAELRIEVTIGQDCRLVLQGTRNELRHPVGGRMADLIEVEFDRGNRNQATITLRFETAFSYQVKPTSNLYMLAVVVDSSSPTPPQQAVPSAAPAQSSAASQPREPISTRSPARQVRTPAPALRNRFVIRVAVLPETEDLNFDELRQFETAVVYTNELVVGDRRWAELRLGFFDTEAQAQQALSRLGSRYDSAWITVANPDEQARARARPFEWPDPKGPEDSTTTQIATAAGTRAEATLTRPEVAAMLVKAKGALLLRNYEESIEIYARLLEEPGGEHRREARELLGVAREKNGQLSHARAEYEAFLEEYTVGPDARRVQQRLAAITVTAAPGRPAVSAAEPDARSPMWEFYGDASQYYLRGVNLAEDDEPDFVSQSAVLSQAYLYARRRGERFDLIGRANIGYLYDLVENGSGHQGLVPQAYLDIIDTKSEFAVRLGRQRQPSGGALGSFDGAHASYRLRPDLTVKVTAGLPIDSPRFLATTDHYFYGASVDLDNVAESWDFNVFVNWQTIDGISDREAVGAEAQYHKDGLNIVGLLDYDASYNVLNTGLITANWRINERLTLYGRYRGGAAPFLTTRNAIIGQPVNTVRELFATYSEGQIRRLARNRTAEERAGSAGLTAALTARLQFKADFAYAEYSDTVASGGVAALPATGRQYSWGGHLIGSGVINPSQVLMVGYRHDETQSVDTDTVWFDLRHPIGERFRIQSRLSVSNRVANQDPAGDIEQWVANPVLRLLYTSGRRYRLELEAGGQWSNREFPDALAPPLTPENEFEISDYYLQLGYTLEF